MLAGSILLTLLAGAYPLLGENYTAWLVVRILQGLGLGLYFTAILTWVADISPSEHIGKMQGVFGISGLLGSAFGPYLLEEIYRRFGFSKMFEALVLIGGACVLMVWLLPESSPHHDPPRADLRSSVALAAHAPLILVTLPFGWLVGTVMTFIGPYLLTLTVGGVGTYYGGFAVASVAVRVFASRSIDAVPARRLVLFSGLCMACSAVVLSLLQTYNSLVWLLAAALLNGLGHGFLYPSLTSHIVRAVEPSQRGSGLALFTGAFDLGILVGAVTSGYVAQRAGYAEVFQLAAGLLAIGVLQFSIRRKRSVTAES